MCLLLKEAVVKKSKVKIKLPDLNKESSFLCKTSISSKLINETDMPNVFITRLACVYRPL